MRATRATATSATSATRESVMIDLRTGKVVWLSTPAIVALLGVLLLGTPGTLLGLGLMFLDVGAVASDALWDELRVNKGYRAARYAGWIGWGMLLVGCAAMAVRVGRGHFAATMRLVPFDGSRRAYPSPLPAIFVTNSIVAGVANPFAWVAFDIPLRILAVRPDHWWEWFWAPATVAMLPIAGAVLALIVGFVLQSSIGHLTADDLDEGQGRRS